MFFVLLFLLYISVDSFDLNTNPGVNMVIIIQYYLRQQKINIAGGFGK